MNKFISKIAFYAKGNYSQEVENGVFFYLFQRSIKNLCLKLKTSLFKSKIMKNINSILAFTIFIFISGCGKDEVLTTGDMVDSEYAYSSKTSSYSGTGSSGTDNSGNGGNDQTGLITAGEWNDLENWSFWKDLLNNQEYSDKPDYWKFYTNNRISVITTDNNANPICNIKVELKVNENLIWTAKTDNLGKAELWIDLNMENHSVNINDYQLVVNDQVVNRNIKLFEEGINEITLGSNLSSENSIQLSFIVDATGSMGDELEFLKKDLEDVIQRVKNDNSSISILTSSVFYRDEGDEYITRISGFTENITSTLNFINQQSANGGGDFPEAVHSALSTAVNELQWSDLAKTKIAFLLLDAPPHYHQQIIEDINGSIKKAAEKGVKIIPITASGIDKETEFLMRFLSISTNGTYVFITNDSGIGNDHIEPSIGEYEVEYLNDLMVRLINKYSK